MLKKKYFRSQAPEINSMLRKSIFYSVPYMQESTWKTFRQYKKYANPISLPLWDHPKTSFFQEQQQNPVKWKEPRLTEAVSTRWRKDRTAAVCEDVARGGSCTQRSPWSKSWAGLVTKKSKREKLREDALECIVSSSRWQATVVVLSQPFDRVPKALCDLLLASLPRLSVFHALCQFKSSHLQCFPPPQVLMLFPVYLIFRSIIYNLNTPALRPKRNHVFFAHVTAFSNKQRSQWATNICQTWMKPSFHY